jgi:hypothetical protein
VQHNILVLHSILRLIEMNVSGAARESPWVVRDPNIWFRRTPLWCEADALDIIALIRGCPVLTINGARVEGAILRAIQAAAP